MMMMSCSWDVPPVWMRMCISMSMSMPMLMLMMPDYATCRLCERLKGQARGVASEGLSLGFLGLATWSESVL